jgi:NDP-hexose-3-ketoreductase
VPAALHAGWAHRALSAGKHVFVEKPLATGARETERLIGLARERGLVLLENMMFVHHPQHDRVAEFVADGAIGELRSMSSGFTIPPKPPDDIRYQPGLDGGALLDIAVYPIRAALRFLGPDLHLVGALLRFDRGAGVEVGGGVLLSNPRGVTAELTFGMEHAYRTGYQLRGSIGTLSLDRVFTPPPEHHPVVRIERQDHREEIVLPAADQFARIVRLFVGAVRDGNADLSAWHDWSRRQAALVDEIRARAEYVTIG